MTLALILALLACDNKGGARRPRQIPVPVVLETKATKLDQENLRVALDRLPDLSPDAERPDVLLIVLDTFRADRLAAWGGDPELAPNLNAFAEQSRIFPNTRSNGTWTLPAHGSLFTGLYPIEHGARGSPATARTKAYPLRPEPRTLAERLGEHGYRRVGIAANLAFLDPIWGLSRGFELWLCADQAEGVDLGYLQGDRIVTLASDALSHGPEQDPLFLFVNFMDVHTPWIPREGYTAHPELMDAALLPGASIWKGKKRGRWARSRREVLSGRRDPSPRERSTWEEAYNSEVRWLDAQIGQLLQNLEALGHGPEDYTIIVSDHGEYLGEHRLLEHSKDIYEQVLRVPLMVRGPGFEPGIDPRPATLRDVPEMLLMALGLPTLTQQAPFEPLQVAELYYSRHRELAIPELAARFNRVRRAFLLGSHKLILSEDGAHEAYDLESDPKELRSVMEAEWVAGLREQAEAWMRAHNLEEGVDVTLTAEQEKRLRELGYVE